MSGSRERLKDEGTRLQVVAAGATSGLISRFVVAPLDVVKIRMQLQRHGAGAAGPPRGTYAMFREIVAREGVTALWKGNIPAELLYVAYSAVQFTAYRSTTLFLHHIQDVANGSDVPSRRPLPHAVESFISGATAGAAATAATYPLDLLRTRFAAQGNERVYASLVGAVRQIARDEGPRGFFRGLGAGLAQIVPFMGIFFAAYESTRASLSVAPLPEAWGAADAAAGVLAGVAAKTAVFPLDLVRKRVQVQGPTHARYVYGRYAPAYVGGVVATIRRILAAEGPRGLYRGLTISLVKAAPASAITMWTYERTLRLLIDTGLGGDPSLWGRA
ncbi:mitochondrial thiamine pyrophosphate carrier 1 [Durotheca rogersii]|uniref:mitochondrial thiamine pyrophosphate carrier 1 n=1 Tax=Durotheca rogersii TaxID=419775 RepID=UPI00221FAC79|nr:mitochondrial thiamine pyrophosphate carrier 1 [Durotheca rogersii]KAI5861767.1 mitochondrial thiamine pyrophosphate carrier 1 [Durotheca rogersii]